MSDILSNYIPPLPADWSSKRRRACRHNWLIRSVASMQNQIGSLCVSDTLTPEAKQLASKILSQLHDLRKEMKTRVDPA